MDIDVGWFADTIAFGDYPPLLRQIPAIAQFLPVFTPEEKAMLKGSYDFFGVSSVYGRVLGPCILRGDDCKQESAMLEGRYGLLRCDRVWVGSGLHKRRQGNAAGHR